MPGKSLLQKSNDPRLPPTVAIPGDDPFAPHVLMDYAARCDETGRTEDAERARRDATLVRNWQAEAAKAKGK